MQILDVNARSKFFIDIMAQNPVTKATILTLCRESKLPLNGILAENYPLP